MADGPGKVARVKMHADGPEFSGLVWGSMRSEEQFAAPGDLAGFLDFLLERGITTIDTANVYGAPYTVEAFLGKALAEHGGRDRFEIVTKCGICRVGERMPAHRVRHFDSSRDQIRTCVERSLEQLAIDVIDVLLVHRPDYLMDPDETAGALDGLIAEGKVRHVGVSNFSPSRLELLASRMKAPIVTNQVEFSPIHLDPVSDGTFDTAIRAGHVPMIWSPVGGGRLLKSDDAQIVKVRRLLTEIAALNGLDGPAEAAFSFVARHPARGVPIVGSGRRERVDGAIRALNTSFDRQDWYAVVTRTSEMLEL
jgi:predicted oxidoreductase